MKKLKAEQKEDKQSNKNEDKLKLDTAEDKLAKAVPGFANARESQILKQRQSGMDVLESTQAKPREGDSLPEAPFGKKPGAEGRDIEVILMNTAQRSP